MERARYSKEKSQSSRPLLSEIEKKAGDRTEVAEHEFAHIIALWGLGKSISFASVIPTSEYQGVTIPDGNISATDMQIAAMASADHNGNGSDQWKAYALQFYGGMPMQKAESIAKAYIGRFQKDILHIASLYLAAKGSATDSELRQFIRWAEEEVREKEEWKNTPLPSYAEELEEKRKNAAIRTQLLPEESKQKAEPIQSIHYHSNSSITLVFLNGKSEAVSSEKTITKSYLHNSWGTTTPVFTAQKNYLDPSFIPSPSIARRISIGVTKTTVFD